MAFRYIPFGGQVHAERRFGDLVLPSDLTVGWRFATPGYAPFFKAHVHTVTQYQPTDRGGGAVRDPQR